MILKRLLDRFLALLFFWHDYKRGYATLNDNRPAPRSPLDDSPPGENLESRSYWRIPISAYGKRQVLLLTPSEFLVAISRANRQPEDFRLPADLLEEALWPL